MSYPSLGRKIAMKLLSVIGLVVLTFLGSLSVLRAADFYVAKNGNDAWSGTLQVPNRTMTDGPLASLEEARVKIRNLRAANKITGSINIFVRKGYYQLSKTLTLDINDGGGGGSSSVTYAAYGDGPVTLAGGILVSAFTPYKDRILKADIANSTGDITQLFYNGERQPLARWPNIDPDPRRGWAYVVGGLGTTTFSCSGARFAMWKHPEYVQVSIWPNYNWDHEIAKVASIDPTGGVTLAAPLTYPILPGRRLFFQNIFEELDSPGEWYFDPATRQLFFWPPAGVVNPTVLVPTLDRVISLFNASNVTFRGFTIEGSQLEAVSIRQGSGNRILGCTIRNTGGYGVRISDGTNNGIQDSDVYNTADDGIYLSGGDRATLTPAGNYAVNNHIYRYAQIFRSQTCGCSVNGVGNRVANNLIHDGPDGAIRLKGNDHMIEYNEIFNVCRETADDGAIYMGRDWTERGNIFRYNKIHHVYGYGVNSSAIQANGVYQYESPFQTYGIYLDDCASGSLMYGNIIFNVPVTGILIGGGRDNVAQNNVIVDSIPAIYAGARGPGLLPTLNSRLEAVNYNTAPYIDRYPALASLDTGDRTDPVNNVVKNNVIAYTSDNYTGPHSMGPLPGSARLYFLQQIDAATSVFDMNLVWHYDQPVRVFFQAFNTTTGGLLGGQDWQNLGYDINSMVADPLFVDPANNNYAFSAGSPAFSLGISSIPMRRIGLQLSQFRRTLPVIAASELQSLEWYVQNVTP